MAERGTLLVVVATSAEAPLPPRGVEVCVCGVGKTGAAVATAARLADGGVRGVVSFGVAGAYPGAGLEAGDVVVASEVAIVDEGLATAGGFVPFAPPEIEAAGTEWCTTDTAFRDALGAAQGRGFKVVVGRIATVSTCAGEERLARERAATGALAEAMEGAAVAYAARRFGVPFAEVRGVSNLCGPREGRPFDLALAVRHAGEVIERVFQR